MTKFIGRQQEVGIAREVTRGTLVAPSFWLPKTSFTVEDKVQKGRFMGSFGRLEGGDDAIVTQKWSEGDLDFELTDKNLGLLLYALFGTVSTGSFLSVFKHTFTVQQSVQPTTLSIMMNDPIGGATNPTETIAYAKAMVDKFTLKAELGDLVKGSFGFVALGHKDYTRQSSTYSTQNKWAHNHVTFKIAANEAGLAAASKINIQSLVLNIERNVVRENALGTVQPVDIVARNFRITGKVKLTYEDRTYRNYMLNGTQKAVSIILNRSDVTIGTTTPQFQIDLPIVDFFDWQPGQNLDDVATQEIGFEALYDVTNSKIIGTNTFVVNGQTSY